MSRRPSLIAAVVATSLLLPAAAFGAGAPPPTKLRSSVGTQQGRLAHSDWTDHADGTCVEGAGIGIATFPTHALDAPGGHARVVFHTRHEPARVRIWAWREVGDQGETVGEPEKVPVTLRGGTGSVGTISRWKAKFALGPSPDWYLRMYARWRPDPVCGGPREELKTYHLTVPGEPPR